NHITPPHFFAQYSNDLYERNRKGRETLGQFRDIAHLVLGVSPYSCQELIGAGYANPRLLPLLVDFSRFRRPACIRGRPARFEEGWKYFLFVGLVAPHKRQEDVIRAFAWYNRFINRRSRLLLVGSMAGFETYFQDLREVVKSLRVEENVVFTGCCSDME